MRHATPWLLLASAVLPGACGTTIVLPAAGMSYVVREARR